MGVSRSGCVCADKFLGVRRMCTHTCTRVCVRKQLQACSIPIDDFALDVVWWVIRTRITVNE